MFLKPCYSLLPHTPKQISQSTFFPQTIPFRLIQASNIVYTPMTRKFYLSYPLPLALDLSIPHLCLDGSRACYTHHPQTELKSLVPKLVLLNSQLRDCLTNLWLPNKNLGVTLDGSLAMIPAPNSFQVLLVLYPKYLWKLSISF